MSATNSRRSTTAPARTQRWQRAAQARAHQCPTPAPTVVEVPIPTFVPAPASYTAPNHQDSARRRRTALLITGAAAVAALLLPSPVSAAVNATASNASTPTSVRSDSISLVMGDAGASLSQTVSGLLPGDTVGRNLSLVSSGAAARNLTLRVSDSVGSVLTTDATRGLAATVQACSVAWSGTTCSGTTTPLITSVPLATLSAGTALLPTVAPSSTTYLRLTLALPNSTETTVDGVLPANTIQNRTAALTYTFSEEQRAAVSN